MMKTYNYTCQDCQETWQDARQPEYAQVPCNFPCSNCQGKNITFEEAPKENIEKGKSTAIISGRGSLGRNTPTAVKERITEIQKTVYKNNITTDW